jgi:hypothetical protein
VIIAQSAGNAKLSFKVRREFNHSRHSPAAEKMPWREISCLETWTILVWWQALGAVCRTGVIVAISNHLL